MFQALSDKTKALLLVLLIVTISILIAWLSSGWQLALLIAAVQLAVVFMARHIWMSDKSSFLLRGSVLGIISGFVVFGNSLWQPFIAQAVKQAFPNFPMPDYSVSPLMLLFLLILATVVFHYTKDNAPLEKPEKRIADLIEGPTIQQKWEAICESLSASIRDIDTNTNWDNNYYTPLDAEVEMKTSNRTQKVVKDLLTAIKESNDRLFLLVGDPGAGKSVAVRKLCLDILKTSVKDEYIPIYVNLKEWTDTKDWTKTPPTWQDLEAFVKRSLLLKNRFLADFFEKYYNVLDENGNLFFILDSFDEIPQVLGTTADAQLIQDLSIVCREFLKGAKQKRSKGILASREYRMPRQEYLDANTKLTVRPFTFEKIEQTLTQSGQITKATVEQLLRERLELVPSMRNPFITSLLKEYLAANNQQFPKNQADLFENYIRTSINKAQANRGLAIPYADVMQVTIQMAKLIFSEAGLQAPLSMLRDAIKHPQFDSIVEIMRYTRIARGDANNTAEFSFAHRRFYEYFVVQDLLNAGKADLPLKSIPTDSRWRDTLVLYCEVAPFEDAQRIANYCWFDVILPNNDIRDYASRHCLRFLNEAFRGRKECLVDFEYDLAVYIINTIRNPNDMPDVKFASECIGVLKEEYLDIAARNTLSYNNRWINETAIRACRHLEHISEDLENNLIHVIDPKLEYDFWGSTSSTLMRKMNVNMSKNELLVSFSLSEAFMNVKKSMEWLEINKKIENYAMFFFALAASTIFMYPIPISDYLKQEEGHKLETGHIDEFISCMLLFLLILIVFFFVKEISLRTHFKGIYLYKSKTLFKKPKIYQLRRYIMFFIFMFFFMSLTNIDKEIGGKIFVIFMLSLIGATVLLFTFLIYKHLISYITTSKVYKNIDNTKCNQREYIYHTFFKLTNPYSLGSFVDKFLTHLENNVKRVYGSYPSETFLSVSSGQWFIRLSKLEERWREAEERAAEAEALKRAAVPRAVSPKTAQDFIASGDLAAALTQALAQPHLSTESRNALIQFQSRLSKLEGEKQEKIIESGAYEARYNALVRDYLSFLDDI